MKETIKSKRAHLSTAPGNISAEAGARGIGLLVTYCARQGSPANGRAFAVGVLTAWVTHYTHRMGNTFDGRYASLCSGGERSKP